MLNWRQQGRRLARYLPAGLALALKRFYHGAILPRGYAAANAENEAVRTAFGWAALPPAALRHKVHGEADATSFCRMGNALSEQVNGILQRHGASAPKEAAILDFGCGCGRLALAWHSRHPNADYSGCDTDTAGVAWLGAALPDWRFIASQPLPPLDWPSQRFDLIVAISVFTHFDANFEALWLQEFARLLKPNGLLAATIHNDAANQALHPSLRRTLDEHGILACDDTVMGARFPSYYKTTYHTQSHIDAVWYRHFKLVGRHNLGTQDMLVLRR